MAANDLSSILASMLENLPRVSVKKHFHRASFLVGKKVFAFIRGDGVVMKLPKDKIRELVDKKNASLLVMGKRIMTEWVIIKHKDPSGYKKDLDLFKEAMKFVSSKHK